MGESGGGQDRWERSSRIEKHTKTNTTQLRLPLPLCRKIVTHAILGTDMTKHFNHIADFESRLAAEKAINENPEVAQHSGTEQRLDKFIMIEMALHCADISNPVKDIMVYKKWVNVVMTEFYQQGDKERELEMPISAMFDRHNSSVTKVRNTRLHPTHHLFSPLLTMAIILPPFADSSRVH